jgi:hypothetical protein
MEPESSLPHSQVPATRYTYIKFALEDATKAQRGSTGIALLFL